MTAREERASFFSLIDLWPTMGERRRLLVVQIVRALAVADMTVCAAVARYCEQRAATREADRVVRQLRNRIQQNDARQAIRQSLRTKGGA